MCVVGCSKNSLMPSVLPLAPPYGREDFRVRTPLLAIVVDDGMGPERESADFISVHGDHAARDYSRIVTWYSYRRPTD